MTKKNTDLGNTNDILSSVKDYQDNKPKIKFEGTTSYNDNFQKHAVKYEKQA